MFKFKKILDESNEKTKSDHFAVKFKKKDSQSISKNRLNLMQYTACLVFNPDTVKNFTFLFKFTPVGAWALRLNDGTELKLSYRWEGPDNKLRFRDKHMSLVGSTKVEIVVFFCSRRFFSVGVTVESSFLFHHSVYICFL